VRVDAVERDEHSLRAPFRKPVEHAPAAVGRACAENERTRWPHLSLPGLVRSRLRATCRPRACARSTLSLPSACSTVALRERPSRCRSASRVRSWRARSAVYCKAKASETIPVPAERSSEGKAEASEAKSLSRSVMATSRLRRAKRRPVSAPRGESLHGRASEAKSLSRSVMATSRLRRAKRCRCPRSRVAPASPSERSDAVP
jgi:hypothetical protein